MIFSRASLILLMLAGSVCAQDEPTEKPSPLMVEARQRLNELTVKHTDRKDEEAPLVPLERPLLKFADEERGVDFGVLWAWGESGRPAALVEMYHFGGEAPRWGYGLVRIDSRPLAAELPTNPRSTWTPDSPNVKFEVLGGAAAPDGLKEVRLKQMTALAKRFAATSTWLGQKDTLVVKEEPVHRYQDESQEVVDGGLFLLNHDTNPELVLFLEATQNDQAGSHWRYGIARCGAAEFHVTFDQKPVLSISRFERFGESHHSAWFGRVRNRETPRP